MAKKTPTDKVAVFVPNSLFHSGLGRLEQGYSILSPEKAEEWMSISPKVRKASPEEIASAYGV